MLFSKNFLTKYSTVFCLFILNTFVNSKYYSGDYDSYFSFDGCEPKENICDTKVKTYPEIFKTYIRGLGPNCEDELSIKKNYFKCINKFFECGYLNTHKVNGTYYITPNEGVQILDGVDLSKLSEEKLTNLQVSEQLIKKLKPFFGLTGSDASNKLESEKLTLTPTESEYLFNIFFNERQQKFEAAFLNITDNAARNKEVYQNLTLEAQVGLLSIHNFFGEIPSEFVNNIFENKWDDLSHQIKAFDLPSNLNYGNIKKKTLRKNIDSYLIDSIDEHIQEGKVLGAFVIDLSNEYKADLARYETYILTIKNIIKTFYDKEQCYTCKNKDIHDYVVIVYRNESLLLANYTADYNETMQALDKIIIPDSYSLDPRTRNTSRAIGSAVYMLMNETRFDKMKTIFLFTNGNPDDDMAPVKPMLEKYNINLAVLDMSYNDPYDMLSMLAEGPYNYLKYNVRKYQNSTVNQKCLGKQVANIFASQNIHMHKSLFKNSTFMNTTIPHNNTIHFQTTRKANHNLKISINLNTFPEENWMKMFVSYNYPYPGWNSNDLMHAGTNYLALKTLVIGPDADREEAYKEDQTVYLTLQGSNTNFGIKVEDCDPQDTVNCSVGTNIDVNDYPFPQWLLAILIIMSIVIVLFVIWYLMKCFRKKENSIEDVEAGINTKYQNIKG